MIDGRYQILSLGAGVQSSTLALMSALGQLPTLDLCIFANTQWEPGDVYLHLKWMTDFLKRKGIPVVTVTAGNLRKDQIDLWQDRRLQDGGKKRYASIPLFIKNEDGTQGLLRRQCTAEYKIEPVETYIRREVLGLKKGQRAPKTVVIDQWRGISLDEVYRLKPSNHKWMEVEYPLVGLPYQYLEQRMSRHDCRRWLDRHFPSRKIPRSACIGCPYHNNAEWRRMRDEDPKAWNDAVEFDYACRDADTKGQKQKGILVGKPYLHRSLLPLDKAPIDVFENLELFNQECEGMCGL